MTNSEKLGQAPIKQLLWQQGLPASIGILVMSIYGIVDTIFVGQFVGSIAIGAITVVLPITYLIASMGMAVGIGGGSIISRALGRDDLHHACRTFSHQAFMALTLAGLVVALSIWQFDGLLSAFGGKGAILPAAKEYFGIILPGIPFLAWAMMANNVIRAEGQPRFAMFTMLVPAVVNLILDPILIVYFEMGLAGAAWATTFSYMASAGFTLWYFLFSGKSGLRLQWVGRPDIEIVKEIMSLGSVTFARQSVVALLSVVLNNTLFIYGGELAVSVYGIIQRLMMFANFPVIGMTQGFLPIAGFNYGARNWDRVRETVIKAISYGTAIAGLIFVFIMLGASQLAGIFTPEQELIDLTAPAVRLAFLATPLILIQLIGSAYFQAIGQAWPALLLTLTKQGFCLIPLLLILPKFFGLTGVWISFPIADVLSAGICFVFLRKAMKGLRKRKIQASIPVKVSQVKL